MRLRTRTKKRERVPQIIEIRITEKKRVIRSNESSSSRLTFTKILLVTRTFYISRSSKQLLFIDINNNNNSRNKLNIEINTFFSFSFSLVLSISTCCCSCQLNILFSGDDFGVIIFNRRECSFCLVILQMKLKNSFKRINKSDYITRFSNSFILFSRTIIIVDIQKVLICQ